LANVPFTIDELVLEEMRALEDSLATIKISEEQISEIEYLEASNIHDSTKSPEKCIVYNYKIISNY
jgi:hypothetical protein